MAELQSLGDIKAYYDARGVDWNQPRLATITALQTAVARRGGFRAASMGAQWMSVAQEIGWREDWVSLRRAYLRWVYSVDYQHARALDEHDMQRSADLSLRPRKVGPSNKSSGPQNCPICGVGAQLASGALECAECGSLIHVSCETSVDHTAHVTTDIPWMCTMCVATVGYTSCNRCRQHHSSFFNPLLPCDDCHVLTHYICRPEPRTHARSPVEATNATYYCENCDARRRERVEKIAHHSGEQLTRAIVALVNPDSSTISHLRDLRHSVDKELTDERKTRVAS